MLRHERRFFAIAAEIRSLQICGTLCSCRATGRGWPEANLIASHHPRRFTVIREYEFG
jgi:hypothetical protein